MSRKHASASEFLASPYDPQIEHGFFSKIVLPNGSFKTTYARRFDDLNALVLPHIKELRNPRILDVAASSGVSTAEWSEQLKASGIQFSMTATDLLIEAFHLRTGRFEALLDRELNFLHLAFAGRGFSPKRRFPLNLIPAAIKRYLRWKMMWGAGYSAKVKLVSKSLSDVTVIEEDTLGTRGEPNSFDVIRTANVLNLAYFSKETLIQMLANLKGRLTSGGLLIVCRTLMDKSNHGTIFRLSDGSLIPVDSIGNGSEIDSLVSSANVMDNVCSGARDGDT